MPSCLSLKNSRTTLDLKRFAHVALLIALLPSCQRNSAMDNYKATVASARTAVPVAVEMEQVFPETDHFITHFGFDAEPKTWNTVSYFGDRYSLTMQVKVDIDYSARQITQIGEPEFFLTEVGKIVPLGNGRFEGHIARNLQFDLVEWRKLFGHRGDLSAIGFVAKEGKVPYFWDAVAAARRDVVRVQLRGN